MQLVDLLKYAVKHGASDLHLMMGVPPVLRINGEIVVAKAEPMTPEIMENLVLKNLPESKRSALEEDLQLCYSLNIPGVGYFRTSIYYEQSQVGVSIRIGMTELKSLEELGLPQIVTELTRKPSGLILITGPTGSGKTTTLNSMIDLINRERRSKIIMVEDPIEYVHSNKRSIIVQQEVYTDTKTFGKALVHILRQDPDVIGVGEMRDLETISTALTAAETGHLVISTLHTPDAPQTIDRIIDVFPPVQQNQVRAQLASSLEAVISQQLIPRMDKPGRVLATEIMIANPAVRNIIRENKVQSLYNVILTGRADQMQTMDSCLLDMYEKGIITYDQAVTRVRDQKILQNGNAGGDAIATGFKPL